MIGPECIEALNQHYNLRFGRGSDRSDIYGGDVYQVLMHNGFLRFGHYTYEFPFKMR
jgi:hypothetical protein